MSKKALAGVGSFVWGVGMTLLMFEASEAVRTSIFATVGVLTLVAVGVCVISYMVAGDD